MSHRPIPSPSPRASQWRSMHSPYTIPSSPYTPTSVGSSRATPFNHVDRCAILVILGAFAIFIYLTLIDHVTMRSTHLLTPSSPPSTISSHHTPSVPSEVEMPFIHSELVEMNGVQSTPTEKAPRQSTPTTPTQTQTQTQSQVQTTTTPTTAKTTPQSPNPSGPVISQPPGPAHIRSAALLDLDPPARPVKLPSTPSGSTVRLGKDPNNYDESTPLVNGIVDVTLPGTVVSVHSPDGSIELTVWVTRDGLTGYRVVSLASGTILLADAILDLRLNFKPCIFRQVGVPAKAEVHYQISSGHSVWRPTLKFERSAYENEYHTLSTWCVGTHCQHCIWKQEWRLFNSGLSIRSLVRPELTPAEESADKVDFSLPSDWHHVHWGVHMTLPQRGEHTCWASNLEESYGVNPCDALKKDMMTPMTITPIKKRNLKQIASTSAAPVYFITQTAGYGFTQAYVSHASKQSTSNTTSLLILAKGEALRRPSKDDIDHGDIVYDADFKRPVTSTNWIAVIWSYDGDKVNVKTNHDGDLYTLVNDGAIMNLADTSPLITRLLAPPTPNHLIDVYRDIDRWCRPGKLIRIRTFSTDAAKQLIDFASNYGYEYIHFDAGWYGDENNQTNVATDVHPSIKHQLDLPTVTQYAHTRHPPVSVALYVNDIALRDTSKLTSIYPNHWHMDGIKFGFVKLDKPSHMRLVHDRVKAFGHAKMYVNIHDYYRPRSFTRTYPHLLTQEGIRGEERKPDCRHHTILPFVRLLAGAADYTPKYSSPTPKCSQTHQLALPIILFSPIQSLYWSEDYSTVTGLSTTHRELDFWHQLPTTFDSSITLGGEIGEFVSIARRAADVYYIATINADSHHRSNAGDGSRRWTINLRPIFAELKANSILASNRADEGYVLEIWSDGDWTDVPLNQLNSIAVRPAQYLFVHYSTIHELLSPSNLNDRTTRSLPSQFTDWMKSHLPSIKCSILDSFHLPIHLAPGGGHCMRLMSVSQFRQTQEKAMKRLRKK